MKYSTEHTGLHTKVDTLEETVVKHGEEITAIKQVVEDIKKIGPAKKINRIDRTE